MLGSDCTVLHNDPTDLLRPPRIVARARMRQRGSARKRWHVRVGPVFFSTFEARRPTRGKLYRRLICGKRSVSTRDATPESSRSPGTRPTETPDCHGPPGRNDAPADKSGRPRAPFGY